MVRHHDCDRYHDRESRTTASHREWGNGCDYDQLGTNKCTRHPRATRFKLRSLSQSLSSPRAATLSEEEKNHAPALPPRCGSAGVLSCEAKVG
jgi:hypothetical protein